jgi:glycosyltransferase involved in cell wall biosynthesis
VDIAIEAFARIARRVPQAEFHIYGAGSALPDLVALVDRLGLPDRVFFHGLLPLREIARVIEDADLGVVPKRKDSFGDEAFSTKIMEFMAMGVPVIVSDTKVDTYYFNDSIVKFFQGGNIDDLAACMLELINNPAERERLARNAMQFVQANSWNVKKHIYFDLLDSLMKASEAAHPREATQFS